MPVAYLSQSGSRLVIEPNTHDPSGLADLAFEVSGVNCHELGAAVNLSRIPVTNLSSGVVWTDRAQTISGQKTFTQSVSGVDGTLPGHFATVRQLLGNPALESNFSGLQTQSTNTQNRVTVLTSNFSGLQNTVTSIQQSGGNTPIVDTGVAWFDVNGNPSTGDGAINNPYGPNDAQKAFDAGFRVFRIGAGCDIGNILAPANSSVSITLIGHNNGSTAENVTIDYSISPSTLQLYLSNVTIIGSVAANGIGGMPDSPFDGSSAGSVEIYIDPLATILGTVSANGGGAFDDGSTAANGGNGGTIKIVGGGNIALPPSVAGGSAVNAGIPGSSGNIVVIGAQIAQSFYTNTYP